MKLNIVPYILAGAIYKVRDKNSVHIAKKSLSEKISKIPSPMFALGG